MKQLQEHYETCWQPVHASQLKAIDSDETNSDRTSQTALQLSQSLSLLYFTKCQRHLNDLFPAHR
ncbi:hypothetical protein EXN66_Car005426 [Channa argus]|uniref:Uncharacterized protein n=1 Tax=Channa argus TaxID=215402 RepID=A0A6G1PHZ0_CHAAH|nr:hypothetical protein EXN66_Car005426 [Channa argus]